MLSIEEYDHLLIRIAEKDMEAFEAFYQELNKAVYGLAYVMTKSTHDAEDIMQNTFVRVWDKAYLYRHGTNAKAWTLKIARNLAITGFRENKRFVELDTDIPSGDLLAQSLDIHELDKILSPLSKEEREILVLYSMGFSHKEIAGIIKKPYATVRWKYRYLLNKLSLSEKEGNYERA